MSQYHQRINNGILIIIFPYHNSGLSQFVFHLSYLYLEKRMRICLCSAYKWLNCNIILTIKYCALTTLQWWSRSWGIYRWAEIMQHQTNAEIQTEQINERFDHCCCADEQWCRVVIRKCEITVFLTCDSMWEREIIRLGRDDRWTQ